MQTNTKKWIGGFIAGILTTVLVMAALQMIDYVHTATLFIESQTINDLQ